ncbi:signal peptidase I [Streptococcus dentiloxodontae]
MKSAIINFLKEWGIFILFISLFLLSRFFIWTPVKVDGHSMDPTLQNGERLFVLKHTKIERFDIVVATETENGETKQIVKRVIGLPGDTITYKNDSLYVNGKKVKENYLSKYKKAFADDKLQSEYSYKKFFQQLATSSSAFTTDTAGNTEFTVTVGDNDYFLLGDNRIVSKDSREVGNFSKNRIVGEAKFIFWPFSSFGAVGNDN